MSWNNLKAGIAAIVRANGNQEITGTNLQSVLNAMVNGLGQNATFAGVAVPSTNPGVPDGPVFYMAGRHGRYSNFGNVRFDTSNAIAIFVWDGSTWSKTELEFTVEGGGGGGGGADIDPSIATFTSSKVIIKVPLNVWDEATFSSIFVGDDEINVESSLISLLERTRDISVSTSATTGEDVVDIETDVLIEGDLEVSDDVLIHKTVTINDGDGEVFIESGVISADGIEADAISAGTILLNRVDLGTTLTALNTKTAGISRTTSGNTNTTVVADNLEVSGGLQTGGSATIGGNVNCGDIFCGLVEAAGFITDGGLNIVSEIGTIKSAVATEVGDTITTTISEGSVIWHGDRLYRALSQIQRDTQWADASVIATTISAELLSLFSNKADKTTAVGAIPNTTATANSVTMQYGDADGSYMGTATIGNADATHAGVMTAAMFNKLNTLPTEITKADVGLGNVDNTSDANKPISTATQNALNGKQDVLSIETSSVVASLDASADKYYILTPTIGTFSITLPTMTDATKAHSIGIYLTTGTTPAVTITGTNTIKYDANWAIEANSTHEINALWNGAAWVLTIIKIS